MVFKSDSSVLVNDVVPPSFRELSTHFREFVNVIGTGIRYRFDHVPPVNHVSVLVNGERRPQGETIEGQFTIVIEVDGTYIQTEANLNAVDVSTFCLSYATAYREKMGGVGPA